MTCIRVLFFATIYLVAVLSITSCDFIIDIEDALQNPLPDLFSTSESGNSGGVSVVNQSGVTSEEQIASDILIEARSLPQDITADIGALSADIIAEILLKSGKFYFFNYTVTTTGRNQVMKVTPNYKIYQQIDYAIESGDTSALTYKANHVYEGARNIIATVITEGMTEYEKALAVHDYLVLNTDYDKEVADAMRLQGGNTTVTELNDSYTPYGLIAYRKGVCQAYSELYAIIMNMLNIYALEVVGTADNEPHSWNKIRLGEDYYNVDVTWDNPYTTDRKTLSRAFFNVTDEMLRRTHIWDGGNDKMAVSLTYNYFFVNNLLVSSQTDFETIITNAVNEGKPYIEMMLLNIDADQLSFNFIGRLTGRNSVSTKSTPGSNVLTVFLMD